jgi:MFS superfamily sulfate permease-like transporter
MSSITDGIILGGILALFIYAKANSQAYGEVEVAVSKEERITSARSAADIDEETAEKALQKLTDSYKRMLIFKKNEERRADVDEEEMEEDTLIYKFPSELTYLNAPAHIDRAKTLHSKFAHVILSCRSLYYVDIDGVGTSALAWSICLDARCWLNFPLSCGVNRGTE